MIQLPALLTLDGLLEGAITNKDKRTHLVQIIGSMNSSAVQEIIDVLQRIDEHYWSMFNRPNGSDENLSHLAWVYIAIGNYFERTFGRKAALPYFLMAYNTRDHITATGSRPQDEEILREYPELWRPVVLGTQD